MEKHTEYLLTPIDKELAQKDTLRHDELYCAHKQNPHHSKSQIILACYLNEKRLYPTSMLLYHVSFYPSNQVLHPQKHIVKNYEILPFAKKNIYQQYLLTL